MIGAGIGRGQSWQSTLRKLSDMSDLYDFCSVCEVNEETARENAQRWGCKAYTNLLKMLKEDKPDVLLNGIAPDGNPMVVGLAAKHGVNAITEIPIAPTLQAADMMIDAAKQNEVKLEVTEQVYLWAQEQLKRKIIDDGLIGEITHVRLWYTNKADYHGINAVRMLVRSRAKRVMGFSGKVPVPNFVSYEGDLITHDFWDCAVIEFENGVVCLFEDPPRGRMSGRWDIEGSKGQLVGDDLYIGSSSEFNHFPLEYEYTTVDGERVLDHVRVETDPPVIFENPFSKYMAADTDEVARMQLLVGFHKAVTEDVEPEYGPLNARRDLEILFALRESARRGNVWMDLPLTEETELEKELLADFRKLYGHDPSEVEALAGVPFPRGGVRYRIAGWD